MAKHDGVPAGALALRTELQGRKTRKIGSVAFGDRCAVLRLGSDSLWAIVEGRKGSGLALRCAWSPGSALETQSVEGGEVALLSSLGLYRVRVGAPNGDAILRVTTTLTPAADVRVPWWPRDLYPLGERHDPESARGKVLAAQRGYNTGLLYGRLDEPDEGTFLYLQDLTALNDYFDATGTRPDGVVGGEWPELGYLPPPAVETPLLAGREIVLSDAFLRLDPESVDNDKREEARVFLGHLAALLPHVQRPTPEFRDWPSKAEATLRDLQESPLVTTTDGGYRYLRPYVGAEEPDSMTQLAVLKAVREHAAWRGAESPLADELRAGVYRFFDPQIGAVRRYLGTVEGKDADVVDSWYLYHPLQNLARLARAGDEGARDLFVASLDYAAKAARGFEYEWPIEFNLASLEIEKASREPGKAVGQTDAGGLYAYVMLDGYEIAGRDEWLEEAKAAIRATADLEFCLVYQTNLTSWGAVACLRLWKITGDRFFLDQASVFLASFFHNCAMWESRIGRVTEPSTFLGVTALHDGPYLAPYECYESFCAFHEALALAEDALPDAARTMMAESIRYALDRAWWFYPASLKETSVAPAPRNGQNARALAFPLEDLYVNGDAAGQVGQEVYAAGSALAYATRAFHPLPGERMLYCEYPVRDLKVTTKGATFGVRGAPGGRCAARLLPPDGTRVAVNGERGDPDRFEIAVGATATLRW